MKRKHLFFVLLLSTFYCNEVFSQQTDSLKDDRIKWIRKELSISEVKGKEVIDLLDQYKNSAKQLMNQTKLTETERRIKFDLLIKEKNIKLKKLLTDEQFKKLIPTSEQLKN